MRHPHAPTPLELARIAAEHAVAFALLFFGAIVGGLLRDDRLPSILDLAAWADPATPARLLVSLAARFTMVDRYLSGVLLWNAMAAGLLQYCMYLHGLYGRQVIRSARNRLLRLLRSAAVAALVIAVVFFFTRPNELGRVGLVIGYSLTVLVLWIARTAWHELRVIQPERLLVLGGGPACEQVMVAAGGGRLDAFALIGRLGTADAACAGLPLLGSWSDLPRVLERERVDRVLLASAPPPGWDVAPVIEARLHGVQVATAREFAEGVTGEVLESDIGADFITDGTARAYGRVSRLLDAVLSAALLVVLWPVLLVGAALVLLSSGRPAFFAQERVGRGGRHFTLWKLRTMAVDAERDGPAWSPEQDARVTGVGRFLRRSRLDELPQLWNVMRGDMSFVGPRPEQPYFVETLSRDLPHWTLRHVVRPGLTGWAQVRLPYGSSTEDARAKLRCDLFYIKHRSPYLDLAILFDTVRVVLTGRGR